MRKLSLFLAAFLLSAVSASAAEVTVTMAWMRALPGNLPGAGYFVLRNTGKADAVLNGAQSPACGMLMLHKSESANGMSSMSDVQTVAVPAGGKVAFGPGGYHLMCMEPMLKPGTSVPVTLTFSDGTKTNVTFAVKNAAGK